MTKKTRNLLLCMLTLCLCSVLVVGGSYALFSDKAVVHNRLSAGTLDVGLYRISQSSLSLGADGKLVQTTTPDTTPLNLEDDPKTLFDLQNIVPMSWYAADIKVENKGSVAFSYEVQLVWTAGTPTETVLAEQIKITISGADLQTPCEFWLSDCATNLISLGTLTAGTSDVFTIKATFVNDDDVNNDAQGISLAFDMRVSATQLPYTPPAP